METLLSTHGLVAGYGKKGGKAVLPPLDLRVKGGELIGLLGANGAGKSTLLRTLAGAQAPLEGSIEVGGTDIARCSAAELARLIAIVYTDRVHAGGLTARQVVALGRHPHIPALGRLRHDDRQAVEEAMATVGITNLADRYLSQLSDGERQKVMIARTLAQQSPVIMLDEPTTFLDVASRLEMFGLLQDLPQNQGKAIIVSTHETGTMLRAATRLWLITHDHELLDGTPAELIASGDMNRMFPPGRGLRFDTRSGDLVLNRPNARPSGGATGTDWAG